MSNALFESGRNAFAAGTASWAFGKGTSGTPGAIQAILMNTTVFTGTGIKQITGATTGATAAAVACVNAFTAGDVIIIGGVLGTTTANGLWVVGSGVSGTSIPLFDYYTGIQGTLAGTYTSGGYAVNLGPGTAGATWNGFTANVVNGPTLTTANCQVVGSLTEQDGIASGAGVTFVSVPVSQVATAIMLVATVSPTGTTVATSDIPIAWIDGQMIVTCGAQLTAGTTLVVEKIPAPIASATVLAFSDGSSATMTSSAAQFARSLAVSSTTVSPNARATAPATGSGLPVTPNGGNISVTWDVVALPGAVTNAGHVGIFKL